jgi:DNA gyrase subunit A
VLNNLYKHTAMQTSFFVNTVALVDGQPRVISLKEALQQFIAFRQEVLTRRSRFELQKAKERAHILEGLKIALDQIDKVIATIRKSQTPERPRQNLLTEFGLSQIQAQAILDMQLRRLANLERRKVFDEYAEVLKNISYLEDLLANPRRVLMLVKDEVNELKARFNDPRRTEISEQAEVEFREEDLIPHQRVVVTLSNRGSVKRVPSHLYNLQHRGGRGVVGMTTRENDAVRLLAVADTHDSLLFFTNKGKVFSLKCYGVPAGNSRTSRGIPVINLFPIAEGERVADVLAVSDFRPDTYLLLATRRGEIKKTSLDKFVSVRSSGLIAMDVDKSDDLLSARLASDQDDVLMVTEKGQSIKFPIASIRASLRTSGGVRGIRLTPNDRLVGMGIAEPETFLLIVTSNGFGKLTPLGRYPLQHRAGTGVRTFRTTGKTGDVAVAQIVSLTHQVMIISADGIVIRTPVKERDPKQGIAIQGRSTQGVRLMRLGPEDRVVAATGFGVD